MTRVLGSHVVTWSAVLTIRQSPPSVVRVALLGDDGSSVNHTARPSDAPRRNRRMIQGSRPTEVVLANRKARRMAEEKKKGKGKGASKPAKQASDAKWLQASCLLLSRIHSKRCRCDGATRDFPCKQRCSRARSREARKRGQPNSSLADIRTRALTSNPLPPPCPPGHTPLSSFARLLSSASSLTRSFCLTHCFPLVFCAFSHPIGDHTSGPRAKWRLTRGRSAGVSSTAFFSPLVPTQYRHPPLYNPDSATSLFLPPHYRWR